MKLSVAILTLNSERHIDECLNSVKWADETVVVDCGSSDLTKELALTAGARVFHNDWQGFAIQRNKALELCRGEWILMLDVDERVTEDLKKEILSTIDTDRTEVGYFITTKNHLWGTWIRSLYPDRHIRLFKKNAGHYKEVAVHETIDLRGITGLLKSPLIHYSYDNLEHFVKKMNRYSSLSARDMRCRGRKFRLPDLILHPLGAFIKTYFLKGGFRDGVPGFVFCITHAFYVFLKYAKLYPEDKNG